MLSNPSMGVYIIEDTKKKIETMYEFATLAARKCKESFGTYISYYVPEMSEKVTLEQNLINEIQSAIENEQFLVYLQPKYNLETEKPYGAEALIRWQHPNKGFLSPGVFIPVFERNGYIGQIDLYMWERVCKLLRKWIDEGKDPSPISVNVSRVNMYNPNLVNIFTSLVKKYDIDPKLLNLELTESAYMEDPDLMKKTVIDLQNAGFIVMMDDFGSGYSSLNTLKDIPVNVLKIDMKFLSSEPDNGRNECILASVIRMAGWLKIPVIMEGVETKQQADFLKNIGCGYAQGYYYAKPMPVDDYNKLISGETQTPIKSHSKNCDELFAAVWSNSAINDLLFNGFNQAAAIYEFHNNKFLLLKANSEFVSLFGNLKTNIMNNKLVTEKINETDIKNLSDAFKNVISLKNETRCKYKYEKNGKEKPYCLCLKYLGNIEKSQILFAVFYDIDSLC